MVCLFVCLCKLQDIRNHGTQSVKTLHEQPETNGQGFKRIQFYLCSLVIAQHLIEYLRVNYIFIYIYIYISGGDDSLCVSYCAFKTTCMSDKMSMCCTNDHSR